MSLKVNKLQHPEITRLHNMHVKCSHSSFNSVYLESIEFRDPACKLMLEYFQVSKLN